MLVTLQRGGQLARVNTCVTTAVEDTIFKGLRGQKRGEDGMVNGTGSDDENVEDRHKQTRMRMRGTLSSFFFFLLFFFLCRQYTPFSQPQPANFFSSPATLTSLRFVNFEEPSTSRDFQSSRPSTLYSPGCRSWPASTCKKNFNFIYFA